jgi:retron-type reverse transcriptase
MIDHVETKSQPMTKVMVLKAYGKLRANKGGAGVDGMTWGGVGRQLARLFLIVLESPEFGQLYSCACSSGRETEDEWIVCPLSIPTLLDRIAQQVVRDHLEKQLEPLFHGSSVHDAVAQSQRNCFNHDFAIDLDIKSYFDTIDHDLMMKVISH